MTSQTLQVRALDHRAVLTTTAALAGVLGECLAGISTTDTDVDETIDLQPLDHGDWTMTTTSAVVSASPARLVASLLEHLNLRAASSVPDAVPFHAAAVAAPDGRVVLLAGSSGSGKSTLAAAAVLRGWGLVAEEVAAVDPDTHRVRPYHRPIGLRAGGAAALGVVPPAVPWFGDVYPWCPPAASRSAGGTVSAIVVVTRDPHADAPSRLAPAPALVELIRHVVVPDDDRVAAAFHRMADLVRSIPVHHLAYDAPDDGVLALDGLRHA